MTTAVLQKDRKGRLLEAAVAVLRTKGYSDTTVDDLCRTAAVTKGAFFHHFESKEDLVLAAIAHWEEMTEGLFAAAPYRHLKDPLERLLGYVDFRLSILSGEVNEFTCLLGTLVQETYATHPEVRAACNRSMSSHIRTLNVDVKQAKKLYAPNAVWTVESVSHFTQAVLQGAFIFAKAQGSASVARANLIHLKRYLHLMFNQENPTKERKTK